MYMIVILVNNATNLSKSPFVPCFIINTFDILHCTCHCFINKILTKASLLKTQIALPLAACVWL